MANINVSQKCFYCGEVIEDEAIYFSKCNLKNGNKTKQYGRLYTPEGKKRVAFSSNQPKGAFHLECWGKVLAKGI